MEFVVFLFQKRKEGNEMNVNACVEDRIQNNERNAINRVNQKRKDTGENWEQF